tara:strand:+ start:364 stop:549 length:186 start_codon:yes stop_codon:yes gene_type:complete
MSTETTETTETPKTPDTKKQAVRKIVQAIDQGNLDAAVAELMTHPETRERMSYAESRMMYG